MIIDRLNIKYENLQILCEKWKIKELSVFGSVLRDDFDPGKSDIDILISFESEINISWNIVELRDELESLFGRKVDVLLKKSIEGSSNPYRKKEILGSSKVIYEQAA